MKDYHINIFCSEEDEGYIADIPDLKYLVISAKSEQSARSMSTGVESPGKTASHLTSSIDTL